MNVISLNNLTKRYQILNSKKEPTYVGCFDVTINLNRGDVYGFIGPNGAGKTTIIRQMMGFIKPDNGKGTILGHDIWSSASVIMKDTGYLAGEIKLPNHLTGLQYLKTVAMARGSVDWNYVEKLIKYFEINTRFKIKKMSKGMKQKIAIIAAFMHKPKILILDEPTSGLDPLIQQKFNQLVKLAQKDGATIFMSSHIFGEIDTLCNKVSIIKKGRIVSEVDIEKLKNNNNNNNNNNKIYEIKFNEIKDYNEFQIKGWDLISKDNDSLVLQIDIGKNSINSLLKDIINYEIEYITQKIFNSTDYFISFYGDEVKFNA